MSQYSKQDTETSSLINNNENSSSVNSTLNNNKFSEVSMLSHTIGELQKLKEEFEKLQKEVEKSKSFYDSATKVNNTVFIVLIVFLLIPVLQLVVCAGVLYFLGIQDNLLEFFKWGLGGIGLLSLVQVVIWGIKVFYHGKRIDDLEKKIENLTSKNIGS